MCKKCHRKSKYSRGLCQYCFQEAHGTPELMGKGNTVDFIEYCRNGVVKELLQGGMNLEELGEKFSVSPVSVRKYIKMFNLTKYHQQRKFTPRKFKEQKGLELTDSQRLALCTPWVRVQTPRYHFAV